ncbi:MAG: TIGR03085 family metal-binding protein [Actinomycetota bacterium]|nr:TIGR03085 family metal-binding protein [Actinomycetota bacterium]
MATAPLARRERHELCDLALVLGEDAPTLCGDWTAKDLVVHLLVRENSPLASTGLVVGPLAGLTERAMTRVGKRDFGVLVERLRDPGFTAYAVKPVEVLANTLEYFVHHEDLRRAQKGWAPRELAAGDEDAIWRAIRLGGRMLARSVDVPLRFTRSDGSGAVTLRRGSDPVTVTGRPSELALFLFGRTQVSDLVFSGPEESISAVRGADLGI